MKSKRREMEIFNMSFLDVISCGFGAIVLLILISRSGETESEVTIDTAAVLGKTFEVEEVIKQLSTLEQQLELKIAENLGSNESNIALNASKLIELEESEAFSAQLIRERQALSETQKTLDSISLNANSAPERDTDEVGGIPVDSEFVVFVIDTSGSMGAIWPQVRSTLVNILNIHPEVRGFQILNDNGQHLVSAFTNKWIPDTDVNRRSAIRSIQRPSGASNSSPMEGLLFAIDTYAQNPREKVSIYVFGDDYSGGSYDQEVALVDNLNTFGINGNRRRAKIHAVGFLVSSQKARFSTLMREITYRNRGTFLALPTN